MVEREFRREHLASIHRRYRAASRLRRARMLDEFCEDSGYHRKYAIRLLNGPPPDPRATETATTRSVLREEGDPGFDRRVDGGRVPVVGSSESSSPDLATEATKPARPHQGDRGADPDDQRATD